MLLTSRIGVEHHNIMYSGADWEHGFDLSVLVVSHSLLPVGFRLTDGVGVGVVSRSLISSL